MGFLDRGSASDRALARAAGVAGGVGNVGVPSVWGDLDPLKVCSLGGLEHLRRVAGRERPDRRSRDGARAAASSCSSRGVFPRHSCPAAFGSAGRRLTRRNGRRVASPPILPASRRARSRACWERPRAVELDRGLAKDPAGWRRHRLGYRRARLAIRLAQRSVSRPPTRPVTLCPPLRRRTRCVRVVPVETAARVVAFEIVNRSRARGFADPARLRRCRPPPERLRFQS